MNLITLFNINNRVEIIEIGRTGYIINIAYDGTISYAVRYFDNSSPQIVTFYEQELRLVKKETK